MFWSSVLDLSSLRLFVLYIIKSSSEIAILSVALKGMALAGIKPILLFLVFFQILEDLAGHGFVRVLQVVVRYSGYLFL